MNQISRLVLDFFIKQNDFEGIGLFMIKKMRLDTPGAVNTTALISFFCCPVFFIPP